MPAIDLRVEGGRVVLDGAVRAVTLGVTDGRVSHVVDPTADLPAESVCSLDGELVLPGLVDGHVHFREPGYVEKEGIASGTAAAVAGGVTTVVEMPNTTPPVLTVDEYERKAALFDERSRVDYALFGAITDENLGTGDVAALADAGVTAFKTFMATSFGPLLVDDKGDLYRALEEVADTGLPIYLHAEDQEYLDLFGPRARERSEGMAAFFDSRPPITETTAVADVVDVVRETGAETVVAHTTTAASLDRIAAARAEGLPIHAEVTPYHLAFDRATVEELGTHAIGTPPVRDAATREALWDRVAAGDVHLFGSDHAPHRLEEKERAPLDVAPGMPQLETALPSLFDAVARGRLSVPRLVDRYATRPAEIHGLYPRKGTLQVGANADFVVVDPDAAWTVDAASFESRGAYSPFDGRTLRGRPIATYQRGVRVAADGRALADPGDGREYGPADGDA